jgi:cyclic pyranopterin phosphate synthase
MAPPRRPGRPRRNALSHVAVGSAGAESRLVDVGKKPVPDRSAGLLASKRTGDLIPMCHPLGLDHVEIRFERAGDVLEIRCRAATRGKTGVEMEALVGATVAALTVYDMVKALDPAISIEKVELLEKRGGRSGTWKRAGRAT